MIEIKNTSNLQEVAILVGIRHPLTEKTEVDEQLAELKELARTAGAVVKGQIVQERSAPDPAFFIGKGKLEQILLLIEENNANLVIFDDELSPAQNKNISNFLKEIKVIDRTGLILDIFADHAKSIEAKTQVELAQLNYMLPRLTRAWQHLSRQLGGIGTKGPGETQLETDRRLVRTRIRTLKMRLKEMDRQSVQRARKREAMFRVALVGYTNAGKSTLMNALTQADVLIEDKLFATLDTTIRRMDLNNSMSILLSDTVGFIRKLPHQLVASFRSTLSETKNADLLLHVVDTSHPGYAEQIDVVNSLLNEIGIDQKNILLVFNKVDKLQNRSELNHIKSLYDDCALFISAERHIGLSSLKHSILESFDQFYTTKDIRLEFRRGGGEHLVRTFATILDKKHDENYLYLKIKYHKDNEYKLLKFLNSD
jgi:GTP-binding protein HflX